MPDTATLEAPQVNSAAPETPPVAPVVPAAVPEVANIETFERDAAKMTPDVLAKLTPAWTPSKLATRPVAKVAAPAAPVEAVAPAVVEPVVEPAKPTLPEGVVPVDPNSPDHPKNFKMKAQNAKEALVFQLHKSGVPLEQAMSEVFGSKTEVVPVVAQTVSQPEPKVDPVQEADKQISTLAAQVAELEAKIDEVAESDPKTALKLTRQQNDLKINLSDAKKDRESIAQEIQDNKVMTAVENHRQLESNSIAQAYEAYPKLAEKNSEQRKAFNDKVAELQEDPAYGPKFRDMLPGWPLMVARMLDAEKGWSRAATPTPEAIAPVPVVAQKPMNQTTNPLAPKTVVPTPVQVPPVRATSAELLSTSINPGGTAPVVDAESFWRDTANSKPADLIALMAHAPIPEFLRKQQKNHPGRFATP